MWHCYLWSLSSGFWLCASLYSAQSYHSPCFLLCFNSSTARSFNDVCPSTQTFNAFTALLVSIPMNWENRFNELKVFLTAIASFVSITPVRLQVLKKVQPWLNGPTCALRQECGRAEHRWKKDRLQISYEIFRQSFKRSQGAVKESQLKYMSDLIEQSGFREQHSTHGYQWHLLHAWLWFLLYSFSL